MFAGLGVAWWREWLCGFFLSRGLLGLIVQLWPSAYACYQCEHESRTNLRWRPR
jgi:hypothetical protein